MSLPPPLLSVPSSSSSPSSSNFLLLILFSSPSPALLVQRSPLRYDSPFSKGASGMLLQTRHHQKPFFLPEPRGKDAAPGLTERDCASASCTVVITSRSISLLPPSTGVTGVLILIVGLLLDVSFHLGSGAAVVARRITACCRCRPFIRGQMKLHREQ